MSKKYWFAGVLVLSLALNGVLAGLILGHRFAGRDYMDVSRFSREILRQDPGQFAEPLREAMQQRRKAFRAAYRELRAARRDMFELLNTEELDREALLAGFERIRKAECGLKEVSHGVLAEVLPMMPVEQRRHFALPRPGDKYHRSKPGDAPMAPRPDAVPESAERQ
jgi:uncharacterized membrane protein